MQRTNRTFLFGFSLAGLLLMQAAPSQGMTHHWSQVFDGYGVGERACVSVDWSGNAILTGGFGGTVDFGGGPLTSAGGQDIFVAKYDANGAHQWSQRFGDASTQSATQVVVDAFGNVVITGNFQGTVNFGGGPLTSAGGSDFFVANFDPHGTHLWSKRFGNADIQSNSRIAVDASGNVFLTGSFQGTMDVGGGPLTSAGEADILVAKLDATGAHLWSERFGDANRQVCWGVATDASGNVLLVGTGAVDLGGGTLPFNNFVAKLDAAGGHLWSQSFAGAYPEGVAVDDSGNVLVSGLGGGWDFGGGVLPGEIFLVKFDASGAHVWSQGFVVTGQYFESTVAVDASANVLLTGVFTGGTTFGGESFFTYGAFEFDMYIAKFDPAGAHLWSQSFHDADPWRESDQIGWSIGADPFGTIIVAGEPGAEVDFGGGALPGVGSLFLVKFGPIGTGVADEPLSYDLDVNAFPNPFNPNTTITYSLRQPGLARLAVYDVRGRLARTLVNKLQPAGEHTVTWNGRDSGNAPVSSGVYFIRLESGGQVQVRKITLIE